MGASRGGAAARRGRGRCGRGAARSTRGGEWEFINERCQSRPRGLQLQAPAQVLRGHAQQRRGRPRGAHRAPAPRGRGPRGAPPMRRAGGWWRGRRRPARCLRGGLLQPAGSAPPRARAPRDHLLRPAAPARGPLARRAPAEPWAPAAGTVQWQPVWARCRVRTRVEGTPRPRRRISVPTQSAGGTDVKQSGVC